MQTPCEPAEHDELVLPVELCRVERVARLGALEQKRVAVIALGEQLDGGPGRAPERERGTLRRELRVVGGATRVGLQHHRAPVALRRADERDVATGQRAHADEPPGIGRLGEPALDILRQLAESRVRPVAAPVLGQSPKRRLGDAPVYRCSGPGERSGVSGRSGP